METKNDFEELKKRVQSTLFMCKRDIETLLLEIDRIFVNDSRTIDDLNVLGKLQTKIKVHRTYLVSLSWNDETEFLSKIQSRLDLIQKLAREIRKCVIQ